MMSMVSMDGPERGVRVCSTEAFVENLSFRVVDDLRHAAVISVHFLF